MHSHSASFYTIVSISRYKDLGTDYNARFYKHVCLHYSCNKTISAYITLLSLNVFFLFVCSLFYFFVCSLFYLFMWYNLRQKDYNQNKYNSYYCALDSSGIAQPFSYCILLKQTFTYSYFHTFTQYWIDTFTQTCINTVAKP